MEDLRVTLVQSDICWENAPENLARFGRLLERIPAGSTDLILLPEMFNTGFSINPALCAETMDGPSVTFLRETARKHQAAVMATLLIREGKVCVNRLICAHPGGRLEHGDKRHLFRLSEEFKIIKAGSEKLTVEINGWKIRPLVCYDLRFPVWAKNTWKEGVYEYDLLVYLANWPASRMFVWDTLLTARAIENQACLAAANRIGIDGFGTGHTGGSVALDAKGQPLFRAPENTESVQTVTFSAPSLRLFRDSFTVGMDWDSFTLQLKK
ncbi:MAG TPA: nitrilase-related carbon-nitrogen hydrolase [Bacteroidales bacterium]|nr:nitrilase-related carbon-nitrogen hydrolase [Bacteroidales bacterium]HPS61416.1 nitrilase-related carbon-nitrogen hydrolase [Bacteroidales bacterium]